MSKLEELISELCPDGVEFKSIENLSRTLTPKIKIKSNDYLKVGKYPVIDQGQNFIGGYTDEENVFPKGEYIIFGDHTCVVKYVDFAFAQGADGIKIVEAKSEEVLPKFLYYCMSNIEIESSYARHWAKIRSVEIPVPPIKIQNEIVRILDSLSDSIDELVLLLEKELTLRKKQYEYYRDQLLTFSEIKKESR